MRLRTSLLLLAIAAPALAQANSFDLIAGGKTFGRDTFTLAPAKQAVKLNSRLSYHINGIQSDITNDFKYTPEYTFVEGGSSNTASQMHNSYSPNKPRTELVVGSVQGGVQDSKHLPVKPFFTVMPHFDAGAAQAFLLLATNHPTPDNLYNIVVPGGAAPAAGATPPSDSAEPAPGGHANVGNNAYDALFTKSPDAAGTLDGKPVPIHVYVLTAGKNTWIFFADDAGNLMQLDNSMVRASYIRAKFKLDVAP